MDKAVYCSNIRNKINLYIDDMLTPEDKSRFEIHLKQCSSCAEEFAKVSAIVDATRGIAPVELPDNFASELRIKLAEVNMTPAARVPDFFRRPVFKAVAASAAALLIVFVAGGILRNRSAVFDETAGMNNAKEAALQAGDLSESSEETFAVTAFGVSRAAADTVIVITAENPQAEFENFKLVAEGYGAVQLEPGTLDDGAGTGAEQMLSAGSTFNIPGDAYDTIVEYLRNRFGAENIDIQEILVSEDQASEIIISITFCN